MSSEVPQAGEEIGDYVDSDNFERSAHIDTDGNFSENIGSRSIKTKNAASGPYDTLPTGTVFKIKKLSNHVDLQIPAITGTTKASSPGSTLVYNDVIPTHDRPRETKYFALKMESGGSIVGGYVIVNHSNGSLTFTLDSGSFGTGAAGGVKSTDIGWDCKY